ncbi:MAG: Sapep family Mn(2+)-dependent dipeptidase, partial [Saccharofermentanales bacterium]
MGRTMIRTRTTRMTVNHMVQNDMTEEAGKYGDLLDSLAGIIAIPSVKDTPSEDAPFGKATLDALDYMLALGRKMGFKTRNLDGYAGYIEFGDGLREVAALCHLDIVPPGDGWTSDPYKLTIKDGRAVGRGVIDDKGPAIACLYAMKSLRDSGFRPNSRIRLILGLDEESGCECMTHYRDHEPVPDIGFTPDAKFPVIYAEKGILHVTISGIPVYPRPSGLPTAGFEVSGGDKANMVPSVCRYSMLPDSEVASVPLDCTTKVVTGRSSHASLPHLGENAISKAMGEIAVILDSRGASNPLSEFYFKNIGFDTDGSRFGIAYTDEKSGSLTCNAGLLSFDGRSASLTLDIRYPVTADKSWIMDTLLSRAAEYGLVIHEDSGMDPLYREPDSSFVTTLLQVYKDETASEALPIAIGGGTYARRMPNIIAFGPVADPAHDVAHQADEYFRLDDLYLCVRIYERAFRKLDEMLGSFRDPVSPC